MAWAYVQDVSDASWDDYQRVLEAMGDVSPEGLVVHAAGRTADGFRNIDVWESKEHWARFRDEHLVPALLKAGLQPLEGQPELDELEVEHLIRGGG